MTLCSRSGDEIQSLLQQKLRTIAPSEIVSAVVAISEAPQSRYRQEEAAVAKATPLRKAEFFAGREAARLALAALGYEPSVIPVGNRRQPIWPSGCVGSITHNKSHAIAIAAPSQRFLAVGIDLEDNGAVPTALTKSVVGMVDRQDGACHAMLAKQRICANTLQFSAKEAGFKAYFPATHLFLNWPDVRCILNPKSSAFQLLIQSDHTSNEAHDQVIEGKYGRTGPHLLTLAFMKI